MTSRSRTYGILGAWVVIGALSLLALWKWSGSEDAEVDVSTAAEDAGSPALEASPPAPLPEDQTDVVLLVIDTLRSDTLGCYGSKSGLTPNLDALAAKGTRFDSALSTSSWTVPAMASMLTGLWPKQHGVEKGLFRERQVVGQPGLAKEIVTLAEVFKARGYFTAGAVANAHLGDRQGFSQGFDMFNNAGFSGASAVVKWVRDNQKALRVTDRPRFIWIHLFDPHHPYRPRRPWFNKLLDARGAEEAEGFLPEQPWKVARRLVKQKIRALERREDLAAGAPKLAVLHAAYESEVGYVDDVYASIFELLDIDEDALVVATVDHGEEFRDHDGLGHRNTLYTELVRVPLIISWPGKVPAGEVVHEPVSIVDIFPTLVDLLDLSPPAGAGARAGVSLWRDSGFLAPAKRPLYSSVWHKNRYIHSIAEGRWRLILDEGDEQVELYDEEADPGDTRDLAATESETAERLRGQLLRGLEQMELHAAPSEIEVPPELEEQLRNMGYVE